MDDDDDELDGALCRRLVQADGAQVVLHADAEGVYAELEAQATDRLDRVMLRWCEGHPMVESMFNGNEGRTPAKVMLMAFKTFKVRLYGFVCRFSGKKTFFIVDIDPTKKRTKADPGILKRAKARVDKLAKEIGHV